MLDLIHFDGNELSFSPEVSLHKPFNDLLERDTSVGKGRAKKEFLFLFLTKDPKSSIAVYPHNARKAKAMSMVYGKEVHIDRKLQAAMDYYEELLKSTSPAYIIWEAAKAAMDRLTSIMRSADWSEDSAFTIKEFATYIKEAEGMASNLAALERKVKDDMTSVPKLKAQQTINPFES